MTLTKKTRTENEWTQCVHSEQMRADPHGSTHRLDCEMCEQEWRQFVQSCKILADVPLAILGASGSRGERV